MRGSCFILILFMAMVGCWHDDYWCGPLKEQFSCKNDLESSTWSHQLSGTWRRTSPDTIEGSVGVEMYGEVMWRNDFVGKIVDDKSVGLLDGISSLILEIDFFDLKSSGSDTDDDDTSNDGTSNEENGRKKPCNCTESATFVLVCPQQPFHTSPLLQ